MTLRAPHFSPRREPQVQQPVLVANLLVTTLAVVAVPFFSNEQTIPQTQGIQQPFQVGSPLALIENVGEKPFLQIDWPNPQIPIVQEPVNQGTFLPLTAVPSPIIALDWPNPTLTVQIQQPYQLPSSLSLLDGQGEKPFTQSDWPNPILPPVPITWQAGIPIELLTIVVEVSARIAGIRLSMSANEIMLREKQPDIRLVQIASNIVLRE